MPVDFYYRMKLQAFIHSRPYRFMPLSQSSSCRSNEDAAQRQMREETSLLYRAVVHEGKNNGYLSNDVHIKLRDGVDFQLEGKFDALFKGSSFCFTRRNSRTIRPEDIFAEAYFVSLEKLPQNVSRINVWCEYGSAFREMVEKEIHPFAAIIEPLGKKRLAELDVLGQEEIKSRIIKVGEKKKYYPLSDDESGEEAEPSIEDLLAANREKRGKG